MTPAELAKVPVDVVSDADMAEMTQQMLGEIGLTYDELEAQAREGRFSSERARLVWFALKPLGGERPPGC